MSKSSKGISKKAEMTLYESIDFDMLKLLISSDIDEELRHQLVKYGRKRKNDHIEVNYHFSKNLSDKGRLYAEKSLSLQNFKKEIRHALAKDIYYDIDMVNCHPTLIAQYCNDHKIECPELQNYVANREKILEKVQKAHSINRGQAKKLILRLCYLGNYVIEQEDPETKEINEVTPEKKLRSLCNFSNELKEIAEKVCDIEREITKVVEKDKTKTNKKSAVLSIMAQGLEHECLMAMCDFFKNMKCKIGVLCFDGLMIEKNDKLDTPEKMEKILVKCQDFIFNKTTYTVKLEEKPMDIELTIKLPEISDYVESDLGCQQNLFKLENPKYFQFCEGQLYVFNDKTGMYETEIETLFQYLIKHQGQLKIIKQIGEAEVVDSYGRTKSLMNNVIPFVKTASKDDDWLKRTENTSLGYLLFKNGIYNMKTSKFIKNFNPDIVFHAKIPWNFPEYDKKLVKNAYDISFGKLFEDPKPMIAALARALAGDIKIKKFYLCPGRPNAGKSKLVKMLQDAFGKYVGNFNAESLAYTSAIDTKDEGQKMRWALLVRFSRILLSNEVNMKKNLDGSAIKKHGSGGDRLIGRNHGGKETSFTPHYTIFCLLNDIPQIEPMDEGVIKRLEYLEFPYVFEAKENIGNKPYFKEMDENLDEKISEESFIQGFIHIILDGYKDFLENGMPEFSKDVKQKWTEETKQQDEIINLIKESFDITNDKKDTISVSDINLFKKQNKNIFSTISPHRFKEILKDELNLTEGRTSAGRFWEGITKKINNDFN